VTADLEPVAGHERRPAYYHAPTRRWIAICACGWRSRDQTHDEHLAELPATQPANPERTDQP
jgi:hypothetical protein